ncbi:hypothetical protein JCM3765_007514 [Sporobolomyces pararoseus]
MSKGKGKERATIVLDDEEEYEDDENYFEGTEEEQAKLAALDEELASLADQIAKLNQLRTSIVIERDTLIALCRSRQNSSNTNGSASTSKAESSTRPQNAVDFTKSSFEWSQEAKELARDIWGVKDWRHCQEAAINASMAGRDVVTVMPTGGGKSLIYQIPALISNGCTIVITPLISLMTDQVQNLSDRDISAEAIHAATSQQDIKSIMKRMLGDVGAAKGKKKKVELDEEEEDGGEIKLVYVTPERIDKSKTFVSTLQKMYDAGKISRFVIDEAHCITMSGHDYRPAYLSLQKLKVLFPKVPVLAVTATAPSNVIADMIKTLGLPKKTSPGSAALPNSTVLFSAPLYRPNLNWSVVPKPQKAEQATSAIIDWILENHEGETGIIYCLSRADAENVAKEINSNANCRGKLKAAVYHAYIDDTEKLKVHERWRDKKIQVVCATNASFGLGIDNPSVRYVVHHTIAKSLANYYQEGGRAGRDGLPSDCVSFFRPADASRLSTLVHESWRSGAKEKLYEMLQFAQDFRTCRKVLFNRYFASTYDDSKAFDDEEGEQPCESCDNCVRDESTIKSVDISAQAYRALRIITAACAQDGTLTLPQAADLVRGNGGGSFSTRAKNSKVKGKVDVAEVAGSKVTLNKDECEMMLLKLLVDGWLREVFVNTAYATNSYLENASKALRFTRLSPSDFDQSGAPVTLKMNVLVAAGGKGTKRKSAASRTSEGTTKKQRRDESDGQSNRASRRSSTTNENINNEEAPFNEAEGEDAEDFPVYGEDDTAFSSHGSGSLLSSDDVVDQDGWSKIVKNEPELNSGVQKKKKRVEVLELD